MRRTFSIFLLRELAGDRLDCSCKSGDWSMGFERVLVIGNIRRFGRDAPTLTDGGFGLRNAVVRRLETDRNGVIWRESGAV